MTRNLVIASKTSTTGVTATDRTLAIHANSGNAQTGCAVNVINKVNDRDRRAALSVTFACATGTSACSVVDTSRLLTCAADVCDGFRINDVIRITSIMTAGVNQDKNDGIHIVTDVANDKLELERVDGGAVQLNNDGDSGSTRTAIVITRLNTFPCSVEETRKGTSEALECSGRGICDGSSGECACFEGYTSDDCSMQTVLQ